MFNKIKQFFSTRKQYKNILRDMSKMTEDTIASAYKLMDNKEMSFESIEGYIRHLPIVGIEKGYPKSVYIKVLKCLNRMWKYSLDIGYTEESSLVSFLEKDIGLKKVMNWDKASIKIGKMLKNIMTDTL